MVVLNYTGGTKAMSVHAYQALAQICRSHGAEFRACYLDDRTFTLYWERLSAEPVQPVYNFTGKVTLSIDDLLRLHGWSLKCVDKRRQASDLVSFETIYALFTTREDLYQQSKRALRALYRDPQKPDRLTDRASDWQSNWEQLSEQEHRVLGELRQVDGLDRLVDYMCVAPELYPEIVGGKPRTRRMVEDGKAAFQYFEGQWLEDFVFDQFQRAKPPEYHMVTVPGKLGRSLTAQVPKSTRDFELDIFMIVGYQLTGISVTTSDKVNLCKEKGFEVIHRSRQIGGEGRAAFLVTALPAQKVEELNADLQNEADISRDRFRVFGREDWPDIGEKIWEALRTIHGD
jgi:hypothetical protein